MRAGLRSSDSAHRKVPLGQVLAAMSSQGVTSAAENIAKRISTGTCDWSQKKDTRASVRPGVEPVCAPFSLFCQTRRASRAMRVASEANPKATVLSVEGVGACDHAPQGHDGQILGVPFVRSTYGQPSCYKWTDADGVEHDTHQHEGGEQGDPFMPLFFSSAVHNASAE